MPCVIYYHNWYNTTAPPTSPQDFRIAEHLTVYGNDSVTVSLQWLHSQIATSYTVTLRPPTTSGASHVVTNSSLYTLDALSYRISYEVELVGIDCAGQSSPAVIDNLIFSTLHDIMTLSLANSLYAAYSMHTVNCLAPSAASGVVIDPYSNTTEGTMIYYNCDFEQCLLPNERLIAVCGSDGRWSPDPANHICNRSNYGIL